MEETEHPSQEIAPLRFEEDDSDLSDELEMALDLFDAEAEADQKRHIVPFRPIIDFIKFHTNYITSDATSTDYDCPICRESSSESHERVIQVDLPACHHVFGADCFERYIQRSHTCPMCREMWFAKRLTPELPDFNRELHLQITVSNEETADALRRELQDNGSELVQQLLSDRTTELSDTDDDTYTNESSYEEELDLGTESPTNYSPMEDAEIHVEVTGVEVSSGDSTRTDSDVSEASRREVIHLMEIHDEDIAFRAVDWIRNSRRSASDDEALALPRQRRRYE